MAYDKNYIKSSNIKVFPCAYRGQNGTTIFDPEARLNTEFNFVHTGQIKNGDADDGYIIKYKDANNASEAKLLFVLHGYYFEINGLIKADLTGLYLGIKIKSDISIGGNNKTEVLQSFEDLDTDPLALDRNIDGDYYFTGLKLAENTNDMTYHIQIVNNDSEIRYDNFLPDIHSGIGHSGSEATKSNSLQQTPVNFDGIIAGATGNYAVALNGETLASGEKSFAHGIKVQATGTGAHAEGYKTVASHECAHVSGNNTKSSRDYQEVIGEYNDNNSNALFIIGNGSNDTNRNNILEVEASEVKIKEKISIQAAATNTVKINNININADSSTKIIDIENAALTIAGNKLKLDTLGNITAVGLITATGTLKSYEELNINDNLIIGKTGSLDAMGPITANNIINAENGIAVSDGAFTVTGSNLNFTIDDSGNINTNGSIKSKLNIDTDASMICSNLSASASVSCVDISASGFIAGGTISAAGSITCTGSNNVIKLNNEATDTCVISNSGIAMKASNFIKIGIEGSEDFKVENGDVTAQSYNAISDKRLKENIKPYEAKKSILDLPVYKYDYINGAKNQIGCMAQDLQDICPEAVNKNENGYLSIQESKIVYLLLEEVKKLKEEIKELKNN